jgi:hypothetical protein
MITNRYLSHTWDDRKFVRTWEVGMELRHDIVFTNPFEDLERDDIAKVEAGEQRLYETSNPHALVNRDLDAIMHAEGFVAIIKGLHSYGRELETMFAWTLHNKLSDQCIDYPVELVVLNGDEEHPWLRVCSTAIFTSLDEYESYLKDLYRL